MPMSPAVETGAILVIALGLIEVIKNLAGKIKTTQNGFAKQLVDQQSAANQQKMIDSLHHIGETLERMEKTGVVICPISKRG